MVHPAQAQPQLIDLQAQLQQVQQFQHMQQMQPNMHFRQRQPGGPRPWGYGMYGMPPQSYSDCCWW